LFCLQRNPKDFFRFSPWADSAFDLLTFSPAA
jgi:hypothetical protein